MPVKEQTITKPTEEESIAEKYGKEYIAKSAGEKYGENYMAPSAPEEARENDSVIEQEPTDEEINDAMQGAGKISPLDPTFLLMFFLVAIPADFLDFILDTLGLASAGIGKIIGMILDVGTFFIIWFWARWKGKEFKMPDPLQNKLNKLHPEVAKKVESKILQKISQKVFVRVSSRLIPALIIEELPLTGIFTSWMVAVISMLF